MHTIFYIWGISCWVKKSIYLGLIGQGATKDDKWHTYNTEQYKKKLSRAGPGVGPGCKSPNLNLCHPDTSFVKFPFSIWHKYQNERTSKSLDVKIKGSHQRGFSLTTQKLQQTQKDERLSSALIAPDETVWLKAAQMRGSVCVCLSVCSPSSSNSSCNVLVLKLSNFTHFQEDINTWLMGPLMGRKVGCYNPKLCLSDKRSIV